MKNEETIEPGNVSGPLTFWEIPPELPSAPTFAFRTASGTAGIFRVTHTAPDTKQVTLQIRLA